MNKLNIYLRLGLVLIICLTVSPAVAQQIQVTPSSFDITVGEGFSTTGTLSITNAGTSDLIFEITNEPNLGVPEPGSFPTFKSLPEPRPQHFPLISGTGGLSKTKPAVLRKTNPPATAGDLEVLVISNNFSENEWIAATFADSMDGLTFRTFDASFDTPSVAFLDSFRVILLFEDGTFSNATAVGDRLYEYVMNGGNLVIGTFYWQDRSDGGFGGSWGNLELIDPLFGGSCRYQVDSLGVLDPHPLTEGITGLTAYWRGGPVTLRNDATAVAWWANGDIFMAFNQPAGKITAVTLFPAEPYVDSGEWSGDIFKVWENAIKWTAGGFVNWLSENNVSGTIPAGNTEDITVTFDGTAVSSGLHEAFILIKSNDPDPQDTLISVPVSFTVLPPVASVNADSVRVNLEPNDSTTTVFTIMNSGQGVLNWSVTIEPAVSLPAASNRFNQPKAPKGAFTPSPAQNPMAARSRNSYKPSGGGDVIQAIVVRSWGDNAVWEDLTLNWDSYGPIEVIVDHTTLISAPSFTLQDLIDSDADVVILSDPCGGGEQYTQEEFAALMTYAQSGHGLIGTYLLYQWGAVDNRSLAPFFGMRDDIDYNTTDVSLTPTYFYENPGSPYFTNIPEPFVSDGFPHSQAPLTGPWSDSDMNGAVIVARTSDSLGIIADYNGPGYRSVFIANMPEFNGGIQDAQFLYNAIVTVAGGSLANGWLSATPVSGTIQPGSSEDVTLAVSSLNLPLGDYFQNAVISTNDPASSTITVPVHLSVQADAVPPTVQMSFFQDTYLTQYLDVIGVVGESPLALPTATVIKPDSSEEDLTVTVVDPLEFVYQSDFKLGANGVYTFSFLALDTAFNPGISQRDLVVGFVAKNSTAVVASPDGVAAVAIPVNAFQDAVYVTAATAGGVAGSGEAIAVSGSVEFGPSGLGLAKDAILTFDLSELDVALLDPKHLVIHRIAGQGTEALPTRINTEQKTASTTISRLGVYQLFHDRTANSQIGDLLPVSFELRQNFPNPFNPATQIGYDVPEEVRVNLSVYNVLGQRVRTLVNDNVQPGRYTAVWDGKNDVGRQVSSGLYFYRLEAGKFVRTNKMLLIK